MPVLLTALLIFVLVTAGAAAFLLALFRPRLAMQATVKRRLKILSRQLEDEAAATAAAARNARKRSVRDTLRESEAALSERLRNGARPALAARLRQAELGWSKSTYLLVCLLTGFGLFLACVELIRLGEGLALAFAVAGGAMLPHWYVNFRRKRRFKRFSKDFPNAVDVIVRGVRSGLPLSDCLKIIAGEARWPVRDLFRGLVEDQTLGVPLEEAVERLPERMPLPEASFFATVIAIQARSGGGLSEALGNLSGILRARQKMQARVRALSAEAVASAVIIGAMPIVVAALLYFSSPQYISLLFTHPLGQLVLLASGLWMLIGVVIMRNMINFKM